MLENLIQQKHKTGTFTWNTDLHQLFGRRKSLGPIALKLFFLNKYLGCFFFSSNVVISCMYDWDIKKILILIKSLIDFELFKIVTIQHKLTERKTIIDS